MSEPSGVVAVGGGEPAASGVAAGGGESAASGAEGTMESFFFQMCATQKALVGAAEAVEEEALSAEEIVRRRGERRKKITAKAEAAMARFASLSDAEKSEPQNQGDLELYSDENMALREALRDDAGVCRALDRWWRGAVAQDDRDKNASLDRREYGAFYARLLKLADPGDELEAGEIAAALEADFKADAGDDGKVTRDEFCNSVFELADQWTSTTDAEEYLSFLDVGYRQVFQALDDADALRFPDEWAHLLGSATQLTPMPKNAATELCVHCLALHAKTGADESLAALAAKELRARVRGPEKKKDKLHRKAVTAFAKALGAAAAVDDATRDDLLLLFARLAGCYTRSGRVKAFPPEGARFVAKALAEGLQPLNAETSATLPSRVKAPTQKRVASGSLSGLVGYVGLSPCTTWLRKAVYKAAAAKSPALRSAAEQILAKLAIPVAAVLAAANAPSDGALDGDLKVAELILTEDVLLVVANLWHATHWDVLENTALAAANDAAQKARRATERAASEA
ncbi:cytochrome P450 [Aureococcus anophagefferens]|uniref:Cytochrome P450 n=1 Tax=Aureococcus anophagefferens TaxID=44056 RepID=A0ABR1GFB1_AURAN